MQHCRARQHWLHNGQDVLCSIPVNDAVVHSRGRKVRVMNLNRDGCCLPGKIWYRPLLTVSKTAQPGSERRDEGMSFDSQD